MVLLMIGVKAAFLKKNISEKKYLKMISELKRIPNKIKEVLKSEKEIKKNI